MGTGMSGMRGVGGTVYGAAGDTGYGAVRASVLHPGQMIDVVRGPRTANRAAVLLSSAAGVVLLWTLSYLLRQPGGSVMDAPGEYARYAVEGMALASVWLAAIAGGCIAALTGLVSVRVRD
jgi:hypothetical protein